MGPHDIADTDAGWSSLVARRAHNPKVAGSNPAPATRKRRGACVGASFLLGIATSAAFRPPSGAASQTEAFGQAARRVLLGVEPCVEDLARHRALHAVA